MLKNSKSLVAGAVLAVVALAPAASAQTFYMEEDANLRRGTEALMAGELETASAYLSRAVKANLGAERLVPALNNLCAVDYALGKLDSAEEACSRAIGEDRQFWRAYVNRGNVRKAKGDYAEARSDYVRAAKLHPKGDMPKRALARLMEEQPKLMAQTQ